MPYVYALQFDDLAVKVGQASDAGKRIARHKAEAARFGRKIVQTWTAEVWDANGTEGRLIDFCLSHGTARPGTREYFTGVPWDTANWDALSLPPGTAGVPWDTYAGTPSLQDIGTEASQGQAYAEILGQVSRRPVSHTGQRDGSSGWDWENYAI